jgi:hypothetical protein
VYNWLSFFPFINKALERSEEDLRLKDEQLLRELRAKDDMLQQELRAKDDLISRAKMEAGVKVREAKAQVKQMAQDLAEKLMKAKEELERSRGESFEADESAKNRNETEEVDLDASTEVVEATEQMVSNRCNAYLQRLVKLTLKIMVTFF